MIKIGYEEAFRKYGAKLTNVQWSVCAETPEGHLVISCWRHKLTFTDKQLTYSDKLSRWSGTGNREISDKLPNAYRNQQSIKLVIAVAEGKSEEDKVDRGEDGSSIKKHFMVKQEALGTITEFDGDKFTIKFERDPAY